MLLKVLRLQRYVHSKWNQIIMNRSKSSLKLPKTSRRNPKSVTGSPDVFIDKSKVNQKLFDSSRSLFI